MPSKLTLIARASRAMERTERPAMRLPSQRRTGMRAGAAASITGIET